MTATMAILLKGEQHDIELLLKLLEKSVLSEHDYWELGQITRRNVYHVGTMALAAK